MTSSVVEEAAFRIYVARYSWRDRGRTAGEVRGFWESEDPGTLAAYRRMARAALAYAAEIVTERTAAYDQIDEHTTWSALHGIAAKLTGKQP